MTLEDFAKKQRDEKDMPEADLRRRGAARAVKDALKRFLSKARDGKWLSEAEYDVFADADRIAGEVSER